MVIHCKLFIFYTSETLLQKCKCQDSATPLVALISLMDGLKTYTSFKSAQHVPHMLATDTMSKEIKKELAEAKRIAFVLKVALNVRSALKELQEGPWWDLGPVCSIHDVDFFSE